MEIALHVIKD